MRWSGYLNPISLALAFGATLLGVVAGCMPGLSATLVITLLTTLTLKMQANQAILVLVCAYNGAIYGGSRTAILLEYSRHRRERRRLHRRLPACAAGAGRPRHGHRHHRLGGRHAVRADLSCAVHADAGRGRAELRRVRVLLARAARRRHVGQRGRRRSAQGLARRLPRPVRRRHRPGRHVCLRALQLRQCRSRRRLRAYSGAGRRLRLLGSAHRDERALRAAEDHGIRLAAAAHHGRAALLAHDPALRRDRRMGRHPARRRRGHGGVVVLCHGEAAEQGAGEIRQGLDRGPDGGGDRRQRLGAGRHHSRRSRSRSPAPRPAPCCSPP